MIPTPRIAAVLLAAAAFLVARPADAARFTSHLDALEAEVTERNAALTGVLTKDQKKQKAAFGKALAALGGDTASLLDELKLAGKVAKLLEKVLPGDEEMQDLLDTAVDALEFETGTELEDLEAEVDLEEESRARAKADRNLVLAYDLFEGSALQASFFLRLKFLQKAMNRTKPVVKFLQPPTGGGGGGGECFPGERALAGGEFLSATYATGPFTAGSVMTSYTTSPYIMANATFHRCTATLHEQFTVYFRIAPPTAGMDYPYSSSSNIGVYYGSGDPDGLTQVIQGSGTIHFTTADPATGTYAGTFTFTNVPANLDVTAASFKIVGLK